jgi:hypothetical protein
MSDLKPGEYIVSDGHKRRFFAEGHYLALDDDNGGRTVSHGSFLVSDIRAAATALIALADELETEYVLLNEQTPDHSGLRIVSRGGVEMWVEEQTARSDSWVRPDTPRGAYMSDAILAAYRAGQGRGGA